MGTDIEVPAVGKTRIRSSNAPMKINSNRADDAAGFRWRDIRRISEDESKSSLAIRAYFVDSPTCRLMTAKGKTWLKVLRYEHRLTPKRLVWSSAG